ncbi:hypothetical protein FB45DRAFT_1053024 [Roridomyces roridus]|uniref:Uncharacterized protein n=1 Tax=Roridomyces roridus TaxID=1738132 RepID=A0AAD7CB63_9AGAR|nr:hypothetical protein FB45DRAFT_1053024 [Roridomyces roridus]
MLLSVATKTSLAEVLSLVQKTVLNAASELEDEAHTQVARISSEANEARRARDEALTALRSSETAADEAISALRSAEATAEIMASKHIHELAQMRATIDNLTREVTHWKDQAKNWQDHYTRVEQDRCGLSTQLLTLSRSALTESPPKVVSATSRPPAYKSAMPPSPTESDSPSQSSAPRNPRTPASKPVQKAADTSERVKAFHDQGHHEADTVQTPAQPVRQIFLRRVQAVVHVKEEEVEDEVFNDEEEEEDPVRVITRRGSGFVVLDNDDGPSGSEVEEGREDDSGDELMMNPRQEIYGGVHPVLTPESTHRLKRPGNKPDQRENTPTKRRRVSDAGVAVRSKAPAKRK